MARTLDQWIDAETRALSKVHGNIERAKAAELVRGVQVFQKNAPRSGKWKRLRSGAARGYPVLVRSIKIDRGDAALVTEHPGADRLEGGGIIRPLTSRFLVIPLTRAWYDRASRDTVTVPISGGRRAVLSEGRARRVIALLVPRVAIRARRWISKSVTETARGSEERIADKVFPEAVGG